MTPFEYAQPTTEQQAVQLLQDHGSDTVVLAGGTDIVGLMRENIVRPKRVVSLQDVSSLKTITATDDEIVIGALTTLTDLADCEHIASDLPVSEFRTVHDVIHGIRAIQVQENGTLGGDLCLLPNCWYFRSGYGLLGIENGESLPELGDNRYHAIFGNDGPAKFVSASRFAPGLITLGTQVRVIGPQPDQSDTIPLESFFQTPASDLDRPIQLLPGQLISHIVIPKQSNRCSATYEVLESEGLDWPQAAAAASLVCEKGRVQSARIVLGHVAPVPWDVPDAAASLIGYPLNEQTAARAADIAVSKSKPLSHNGYKVHMTRTCVERALLQAVNKLRLG